MESVLEQREEGERRREEEAAEVSDCLNGKPGRFTLSVLGQELPYRSKADVTQNFVHLVSKHLNCSSWLLSEAVTEIPEGKTIWRQIFPFVVLEGSVCHAQEGAAEQCSSHRGEPERG